MHGAEFKAQVLAECQQSGASVAAIALAHGLDVNLLRKWLVGRGLKRTGLAAPRSVAYKAAGADDRSARALQFIPVEIAAAPGTATAVATGPIVAQQQAEPSAAEIHVVLTRGATQLSVRWPSAQAAASAQWLRELAVVALKD